MLVAVVVRLHGLGAPNLWLDEANSWYVAHLSWAQLSTNLRTSPVGPVYFVALKLWMDVFGTSEAALRAPSLLASVILVPLVYALGVRTVSMRAARVAAALTALSPLHLYFAQEARMYMLLALLAAASTLAYVHWRDAVTDGARRGRDARPLAAYALLAMIMLGTNVVSAPLLVALNIDAAIVIWRDVRESASRRRAVIGWMAANALVGAVALGLLLNRNPDAAAASQAWRQALGIGGAARALVAYPVAAIHGIYFYPDELARALGDVRLTPGRDTIRRLLVLVVAQPVVIAVLVVALRRAAADARGRRARAIALALAIPLLIGAAISVRRQVDLSRYFLYASTFLFLFIGAGLARLSRGGRALALACLVAAIALGSARTFNVGSRDSDYRTVAAGLAAREDSADVVLVQPAEMLEPLTYYLRGHLHRPLYGVGQHAPLGAALAGATGARAWLVLDYRSPAYPVPPDILRAALDACVLDDRYDAGAGAGVRLVLVARASTCTGGCATCR